MFKVLCGLFSLLSPKCSPWWIPKVVAIRSQLSRNHLLLNCCQVFANHLPAFVFPSQYTLFSLWSSRISTWIWFRLCPGNTCCSSLNGVPLSPFARICFNSSSLFVSRSKPTTRVWTPDFPAAAYKLLAKTYVRITTLTGANIASA